MHRHALSDAQWERLSSLLPTKRTGPKTRRGDRLFLDAVIYRLKTGVPWRDLPERFARGSRFTIGLPTGLDEGCGGTFLSRYSSTSMTRVRSSTIPSSARTKTLRAEKGGVQTNCLGRCRGGFSTKIHVVVDLRGRPLFVTLTPGQRHETTVAQQLIEHAQGRAFLVARHYLALLHLACARRWPH